MEEKRPNHRPYKKLEIPTGLIEEYYTIYEVADLLKVHHKTVRRMIKDERLPAQRLGREWRIKRDDIEKAFR